MKGIKICKLAAAARSVFYVTRNVKLAYFKPLIFGKCHARQYDLEVAKV
jgi:hypothetical protein